MSGIELYLTNALNLAKFGGIASIQSVSHETNSAIIKVDFNIQIKSVLYIAEFSLLNPVKTSILKKI